MPDGGVHLTAARRPTEHAAIAHERQAAATRKQNLRSERRDDDIRLPNDGYFFEYLNSRKPVNSLCTRLACPQHQISFKKRYYARALCKVPDGTPWWRFEAVRKGLYEEIIARSR